MFSNFAFITPSLPNVKWKTSKNQKIYMVKAAVLLESGGVVTKLLQVGSYL